MRIGRNARNLNQAERQICSDVFQNSLPAWSRIFLDDGLGYDDRPYTIDMGAFYIIHIGPVVYPDASLKNFLPGYGLYPAILVHEMTHVWQYHQGDWVVLRSMWANTGGSGYSYTPGDDWDDYNVEQQAHIVEDWYARGMLTTDSRYRYIDKVIRAG